jgi:hypothetical protein
MKKIFWLKKIYRLIIDFKSYILFNLKYKIILRNYSRINKIYEEGVTVVITSCGRPKYLEKMLESFIKYNTFIVYEYIFVEDSGCIQSVLIAKKLLPEENLKIIFHEKNIGQLSSIDEAYKKVKTNFVFHIEEDWEFIRSGFIELSLEIFRDNDLICCLSLRPHTDWEEFHLIKINNYYLINKTIKFIWCGIGINPGIYQMSKYDMLGSYFKYNKERQIAQAYKYLGFYGGVSPHKDGFVVHKGGENTTRRKFKTA